MGSRKVGIRRGRHLGWWVEARTDTDRLLMLTWWPTEGIARAVAGWIGKPAE